MKESEFSAILETQTKTFQMLLENQQTKFSNDLAKMQNRIDQLITEQKASHQDLLKLTKEIEDKDELIQSLREEIQTLKNKKKKDSNNSSLPPSSDGLHKKNKTSSLREGSEKKQGGQTGHEGKTITKPKHIDHRKEIYPTKCLSCPFFEQCKKNNAIVTNKSRYVLDVILKANVTQYSLVNMKCHCNNDKLEEASFPDNIKSYIQYGSNLESLIVLLNHFGLSCDRIEQIIDAACGISLCQSTVVNKVQKCADKVSSVVEEIRQRLINSKLVYFDETGVRIDGSTRWVHSSSSELYTYLTSNVKRGRIGIKEHGVLQFMNGGVAIHDCWPSYWAFNNVSHQICLVHVLRELKYYISCNPNALWSKLFKDFLIEIKKTKEKRISEGYNSIDEAMLRFYSKKFDRLMVLGRVENPLPLKTGKRGRPAKGELRALIDRLTIHKDAVLLFIYNFEVPFDNSTAERSVRNVKIKMRNAGCFRSWNEANNYLKIRSYLDTARKLGKNLFETINQALIGNPEFIFSPSF